MVSDIKRNTGVPDEIFNVFEQITGVNNDWFSEAEYTATITAALPTLIIVTTLSALIILLTIITAVLALIKDRKQCAKPTAQMDTDLHTRKYHTI